MRLFSNASFLLSCLALSACGVGYLDAEWMDEELSEDGSALSSPALRGAAYSANSTASSLTLARPAVAAGDLLVAVVAARGTPTLTAPSGWTRLRSDPHGTTMVQQVFYKVALASEPASYRWALSKSVAAAGGITSYRGVDLSAPIAAHSGRLGYSTKQITAPSLNAPAGARLVAFFGAVGDNTISPPPGMVERGEAASVAGRYKVTVAGADQAVSVSGSTGSRTATSRGGHDNVGQMLALRLAPTVAADAGTAVAADAGTPIVDAGTPTVADAGQTVTVDAGTPTTAPSTTGLLTSAAELASRPMSGSAWTAMKSVADGSLGTANIADQDNRHGARVLAVALVYARTGNATYREKARVHLMAAIGTEVGGRTLALGRNLAAYVLAADLIGLSAYHPADDLLFRSWLTSVRTAHIGNHGRWVNLKQTHEDAANNWGTFAGASRIAASLYLGDAADVAQAALVLRGHLGDRAAYQGFGKSAAYEASWSCNDAQWVAVNPTCSKSGINVDGALVEDISRGGPLAWPPGETGIMYTSEALQGLYLQAELLRRAGHDPFNWSNQALRRAADFLFRAGWTQPYSVDRHLPWLFNARYGTTYPTTGAGYGRVLGYTDWLYP